MKRELVGNAYRRYWTRDRIVAAIKRWHRQHGEAPRSTDWDVHRARKLAELHERLAAEWRGRIAKFEVGRWPSVRTVREQFGGWNNAIAAAGFEPRSQGQNTPRGAEPSPLLIPLSRALGDAYAAEDRDDAAALAAALRRVARIASKLAREVDALRS